MRMHHVALLVAMLLVFACKKEKEAPPTTETPKPVTPAAPAPAPAPALAPAAPAAPAPAPVKLGADELKPTCAKIFTAGLAAKTHGATEVKSAMDKPGPMTVCQLIKDGAVVGSATIACNPDLDPTAIERERAAMTKDIDLTPSIGRGGYRISSNFTFIDDETPCRIIVNWMTTPADDVWPDALRAITAAVNPSTLK
jgi:hypothetical protein